MSFLYNTNGEFINPILYSNSLDLFFIVNLTSYRPDIWYQNSSQNVIGLYKNSSSLLRKIYQWDMYQLADTLSSGNIYNYQTVSDQAPWNPIWIPNYHDNHGNNALYSLPTGFPVNIQNAVNSNNLKNSGDFSISPMIPSGDFYSTYGDQSGGLPKNILPYADRSITWNAEYDLWQFCIIPAMPLLISSTIEGHRHFGPMFLEQASFSAESDKPVSINFKFTGGRSILNTAYSLSSFQQYRNTQITPSTRFYNLPSNYTTVQDTTYQPYRVATAQDCAVDMNVYNSTSELLKNMFLSDSPDSKRISKMSLTINQQYEFTSVSATPKRGVKTLRNDLHGPRFIALVSRNVTGSITIDSRRDPHEFIFERTKELSMFFGGPFMFSMDNVDWQDPNNTISIDKHQTTYNFVARASSNASASPFLDDYDFSTSEFITLI